MRTVPHYAAAGWRAAGAAVGSSFLDSAPHAPSPPARMTVQLSVDMSAQEDIQNVHYCASENVRHQPNTSRRPHGSCSSFACLSLQPMLSQELLQQCVPPAFLQPRNCSHIHTCEGPGTKQHRHPRPTSAAVPPLIPAQQQFTWTPALQRKRAPGLRVPDRCQGSAWLNTSTCEQESEFAEWATVRSQPQAFACETSTCVQAIRTTRLELVRTAP